jgi:predicted kinase
MASVTILVNGLPASGKSTLAVQLGQLLDCPVLTKDALKEPFGELLGGRADSARLGALAMDTLWRLAAETDGGVIVDAVLPRSRDLDHVRHGLLAAGSPRTVELWCEVPVGLAQARFRAREPSRADVHRGWDDTLATMEPLGAWPLIRVDTTQAVDFDALVQQLGAAFL